MSKRKSHTPSKMGQVPPDLEFSFGGKTPANESSKINKKVSFQLPNSNDDLSEQENSTKFKRKKVCKTFPQSYVILGELSFPINQNLEIDIDLDDTEYWLLINDTEEYIELMLKISNNANKKVLGYFNLILTSDILLNTINDLLQHKCIWVIKSLEDLKKGFFNVFITTTSEKSPIFKASRLVELFFEKCDTNIQHQGPLKMKTCTKEFFKELKEFQKNQLNFSKTNVQHEKLIPKLRPYQENAVKWMIFRESANLEMQTVDWLSSVVKTYSSACGKNVYYNKYSEVLYLDVVNFSPFPKGGILADEMGLGKTVAVISLILSNKHNLDQELESSDFLLPVASKPPQSKIICHSEKTFKENNEIIKKNKESYLDADEKLIYNKVSKGSALKAALTEWYESKLAEYKAATPSKVRRMNNYGIKCVCGNVNAKKKEDCVQCVDCEKFQHSKCVGFHKKFLYYCPPCWTKQKLVKSSATLIVAPSSIYHQWFDEIQKHVKPNSFENGVFMYKGVKEGFVQPSVLASYDVVITTYATLIAEVSHAVGNESSRKLRNEERFLKMCSPLRQVHWWRLCLDEAQMVENDFSKINQMLNLLSQTNRWSVTGTPIQKSINDLYYLIEWLGIEPYNLKALWNNFLYLPYLMGNKTPLHSVVSKVLWRSSKEEVGSELLLPEQRVQYHFLKFTAIEQNFYMREHTLSSNDFSERLTRLRLDVNRKIESLDKATLTKLLAPLLNLRQACSHPMAVKGSKIYSKTGSMTLAELLQYLFNKTKLECEEEMRKYVSALNGLAGIHCIREEWYEAVEYYRKVLQFTEEYKEKIHIDSLQRIHTMTNLAEILQQYPEGIPFTLRDESLLKESKNLEEKYMQNVISDLQSDENLLNTLTEKVSELENKFETESGVWWNHVINLLTVEGSVEELLDKISTELSTNEWEKTKQVELFLCKITTVKGLEIVLRNWLSDIGKSRSKALKHLNLLRKNSCESLVYHAVDCHLRIAAVQEKTKKKKCPLCVCELVLLDYECILFDVSKKVLKEEYEKVLDGAKTKGSWRAQKAEKCLKILLSFYKSKSNSEPWCVKDGKTHIQLLEAMKKEFKQIRAVWMSLNHRVQACDEISMCKLRLRLRLPGELVPPKVTSLSLKEHNKVETIFIIEKHEVDAQRLKLLAELELCKSEFKKKYGTLLYLQNLGQNGNQQVEPCPVCKTVLDNEWCVLQCGHSYCIDCIRIMLNRSSKCSLNCPVCRETTKSSDLSFIDLSGKQENSDINVIGDHSTKIDGILRSLLQLKKEDPKVKVLIFSTWGIVLKILEVALTQNDISFRRMPGHNYQTHLKQFKDPALNITVLLLPISWGSKGLNLIEASHVFLVEPIMNPAEELQAVGRVHRIGQTKETVVHRYLISGTIEEKIHMAVSEAKDKWGQKQVTLEDLKNLFDMKNEFVTSDNAKKLLS